MKNKISSATRGWQKVFGFSLIQHIKTKSFIVGTIIACTIVMLLVAGVNIIPKLIDKEEEIDEANPDGKITLSTVYIDDSAGILTDEDFAAAQAMGLEFTKNDREISAVIDELSAAEKGKALVLIAPDMPDKQNVAGYSVKTYYSPKTEGDDIDTLSSLVSELVKCRNLVSLGLDPADYAASQRYVSTSKIEAGKDEWSIFESALNYFIPIVVSMVLFILIFSYGSTVAQSIATEKTSRVMELLLTSVRPLAVVVGKVLAMGLVSLGQFLLIGIVGGVTFFATAPFGVGGDLMEMLKNAEQQVGENAEIVEAFNNSFGSLNFFSVVLIFVMFILGFLFYSLIAALVGASVSRMEDLAQAMQPLSLLGVLGLYLTYFPVMFNMDSLETGAATVNPVQIFSYYFPVSSPFALPSALLLGTLSLPQVLLATLILAVFVVLIAIIVARVYEMIILHNGSRIKFGEILKMAGKKQ